MSSEQSIEAKSLDTDNNVEKEVKLSKKADAKVDINQLLLKLREKEKLQKKENLLFFGVVGSVVIATGVIASL